MASERFDFTSQIKFSLARLFCIISYCVQYVYFLAELGTEEQRISRHRGTVGTEEQRNSRHRGAEEKLAQRNSRHRGAKEQ